MKNILLTFLMLISFIGFAQDPQLDDNTWYLQNVIINGSDNLAPVNAEITEIVLNFFYPPYDFDTYMCNSLNAEISFDDVASTFTLSDLGQTLSVCGIPANSVYEQMYFNLFWANSSNPFLYTITSNSSISTLTITASNGDQAIYGNFRLGVNQFKVSDIKTYPNPVITELTIEKQQNLNLQVAVYNMNGQHMFSKLLHNGLSESMDVSGLKPGVYFLVLEADNQRKDIRKIIKI